MLGRVSKSQEGQKTASKVCRMVKLILKGKWPELMHQLNISTGFLSIQSDNSKSDKMLFQTLLVRFSGFYGYWGKVRKNSGEAHKGIVLVFLPGKKWDPSQIRSWSKEWGKHYFSPIEIIVIQAGAELGQAQLKLRLDLPCQTPASYLV